MLAESTVLSKSIFSIAASPRLSERANSLYRIADNSKTIPETPSGVFVFRARNDGRGNPWSRGDGDKGNRYLSVRAIFLPVINNRTSSRSLEDNFDDYFGNDYCRGGVRET